MPNRIEVQTHSAVKTSTNSNSVLALAIGVVTVELGLHLSIHSGRVEDSLSSVSNETTIILGVEKEQSLHWLTKTRKAKNFSWNSPI